MDLKAIQAPLKRTYQAEPGLATVVLFATGEIDFESVTCKLTSSRGLLTAGLHPLVGGDGSFACSGEMLLESLVACSGVTCAAVATSLGLSIRAASVRAEGDWDARGTLGVSRDAPVGFSAIRLELAFDTTASEEELERLLRLTERYCVVLQTLAIPATLSASVRRQSGASSAAGKSRVTNRSEAERFAGAWIEAWNRRDIEPVLSTYADELSFTSPTALEVVGRATLRGKSELRSYWQKALTRIARLEFVLDRCVWDEASRELAVIYTRHIDGSSKRVVETFRFGPDDLVLATEVLHGNVPESGH